MTAIKKFRFLLPFIGIGLFAYILSGVDLDGVAQMVGKANPLLVVGSLIVIITSFLLKIPRHHWILQGQGISVPFRNGAGAYVTSAFWGLLSPGRLGEFSRAFFVAEHASKSKAVGNVIIDRVMDLGALVFYLAPTVAMLGIINAGWIAVLFVLVAVMLWMMVRVRLNARQAVSFPLAAKLQAILVDAFSLNHPWKILALTLIIWVIHHGGMFMAANAMNIDLSFLQVVLAVSLSYLVAIIPITFAGIGTRDGVLVFLFSSWGLEAEAAIAFSAFFLLSYVVLTAFTFSLSTIIKNHNA